MQTAEQYGSEGRVGAAPTYEVAAPPSYGVAGGYPQAAAGGYNPGYAAAAPVAAAPVSQPYQYGQPQTQYAQAPAPQMQYVPQTQYVPQQMGVAVQMSTTTQTVASRAATPGRVEYDNPKKKWCVCCCLSLAMLMAILALSIDMMVLLLTDGDNYYLTETCGYNAYKYTLKYDNGGGKYTGKEKYKDMCDSDYYDDDWCDTEEKGEAWIGLAVVALLIAVVPIIGIAKLNIKWPIELLSVFFVIIGMLVFYDEKKNVCWDPDHDGRNMGATGGLMITAIVFWVIASISRFICFN